jgi:hypothetical protein
MHALLAKSIILPLATFFAQVGGTPDNAGIFILVAITFVLLGAATIYFIEHKKGTAPSGHIVQQDEGTHREVL